MLRVISTYHPFARNKHALVPSTQAQLWGKCSSLHFVPHTIFKNLETTVATPRKKWGRVTPSNWCDSPLTSTNAPICLLTSSSMPLGYISETWGTRTVAGPSVASLSKSLCSVLGYVARSSWGANCAGLTKIVNATWSHCAFAALTSIEICQESFIPSIIRYTCLETSGLDEVRP